MALTPYEFLAPLVQRIEVRLRAWSCWDGCIQVGKEQHVLEGRMVCYFLEGIQKMWLILQWAINTLGSFTGMDPKLAGFDGAITHSH